MRRQTYEAEKVAIFRWNRVERRFEFQVYEDQKTFKIVNPVKRSLTVINALPKAMGWQSHREPEQMSEDPDDIEYRFKFWITPDNQTARALYLHLISQGDGRITFTEDVISILERVGKDSVDSKATESNIQIPATSKGYKPYPYQLAGIEGITKYWEKARKSGIEVHPILADDVGLGKTAQALCSIQHTPWVKTFLVICPNSVKYNWKKEINNWLGNGDPRWCVRDEIHPDGFRIKPRLVQIYESSKTKSIAASQVLIINWDALKTRRVNEYLNKNGFDVIIADECQAIKNRTSARAKAFIKMFKNQRVNNRSVGLFLSATLIDKIDHAYVVANLCKPSKFSSIGSFKANYPNSEAGAQSLNRALRGACLIGRKKADVGMELPKVIYSHINIDSEYESIIDNQQKRSLQQSIAEAEEMKARYAKAYEAAKTTQERNDIKEALQKEFVLMSKKMDANIKGIKVSDIARERREIGMLKVPLGIQRADELTKISGKDTRDQMILFTFHKDVARAVADGLSEKGISNRIVNGDTTKTAEQKEKAIQDHREGKYSIMIAGVTSMNAGWNGEYCNKMLMLEPDWNGTTNAQCEGRCDRNGQVNPVTIEYHTIDGTIDALLFQLQASKRSLSNELR